MAHAHHVASRNSRSLPPSLPHSDFTHDDRSAHRPPRHHPDLPRRRHRGPGVGWRRPGDQPGRIRRDHWAVGFRQVDPDVPARLPRPAHQRQLSAGGARDRQRHRCGAVPGPQPGDRLRLPELQPAAPPDGGREHRPGPGLCRDRPGAAGAAVRALREALRPGQPAGSPSPRTLGWPDAAGRHRPLPRRPSPPDPGRRTDRQPGQQDRRRRAADLQVAPCRRQHRRAGDPRSERGGPGRPDHPDRRREDRLGPGQRPGRGESRARE